MALDPTIATQTQVPQIQGPLQLLSQQYALQQARQALASGQQAQQLRGLQIQQAQHELGSPSALSQVITDTPSVDLGGGVKGYDVGAISKGLAAKGYGDQVGPTAQHLDAINQATMAAYQSRLNLVRLGAVGIAQSGYDPTLATHFIDTSLRPLIGNQEADQAIASIAKNPGSVKALVDSFILPEQQAAIANAKKAGVVTLQPGEQAVDLTGGLSSGAPTVGGTPTAGGTPGAGGPSVVASVPPKTESVRIQLNGREVYGNRDPITGKIFYLGQDVTPQAIQTPPVQVQIQGQIGNALSHLPTWASDASAPPAGASANVVDPALGLSPNGLYAFARQTLAEGRLPYMRGSQEQVSLMQTAVMNKIGAMAQSMGMTTDQFMAAYKANAASLGQQQKYADAASAFLATADKNAQQLAQVLPKIGDTGSPIFNKPVRVFQRDVSGNPNLSQFATYLTSVQNEYGKILNNPNLAGQLTDSARHEAQALIDPKATAAQVLASVQALNTEGTNRLQSIDEQLQRIMGRMQTGRVGTGGGTGGSNGASQPPAAPPGWKYVPKAGGGWTAVPTGGGQ